MSYETIDPILIHWATQHSLELFTRYKDSDVRTVFLPGPADRRSQIWIDPPSAGGDIAVHAALCPARGKNIQTIELHARASNLEAVLEQARATAEAWLKET